MSAQAAGRRLAAIKYNDIVGPMVEQAKEQVAVLAAVNGFVGPRTWAELEA